MLIRRGDGLVPAYERDEKWLSGIKQGEYVLLDARSMSRRSYEQHKFWFALLNLAWEQSEAIQRACGSFDAFRGFVLNEVGFCEVIKRRDGEMVKIPKSISFAECDADEFRGVVDRTLDKLSEWGFDIGDLERNAAQQRDKK